MASRRKQPQSSRPTRSSRRTVKSSEDVACWEDDPGDPGDAKPLAPITVPAPSESTAPMPFTIGGAVPPPRIYQAGTAGFLFYAAACALRRTASFWGPIIRPVAKWQTGRVLDVQLDSGVDLNAYYTRGGFGDTAGLHFFHESVGGRVYFSGESPDVASHEMGHAVLDAIKPQLWDAQSIETAAFHESFGDMSALLSALQVPSFRQTVLAETNGVVNRASRLSRLAEQLGAAIRMQHPDATDPDCLRNAANSFFYRDPQTLPASAPASQLSSEPHSFSRVFTGAFLDALAGIFKLQPKWPNVGGLAKASEDAARILVGGVREASVVADFYSQVAAHMVQIGDAAPFKGRYRDVLKSAFVRRGILSVQAAATLASVAQPARRRAAIVADSDRTLPMVAISASQYGLASGSLHVFAPQESKRLAVTGSSTMLGPIEPRSAQNAAESFTEDLFQRGHVLTPPHLRTDAATLHPFAFKTHIVVEEDGKLVLRRRTFDCGFAGTR